MAEIVYKAESYAIIGACFEVYNEKGCGFLEPVYQECLGIEFEYQGISGNRETIADPELSRQDIEANLRARLRLLRENYRRIKSGVGTDGSASCPALELPTRNGI